MKNKSLIIIVLQSALIICLLWLIIYLGKDEIFRKDYDSSQRVDDEFELDGFVSIEKKMITIPSSVIKNSGIEIQPIAESKKRSLYYSYGYVMNLKELIISKTKSSNMNFKFNQLNKQLEEEEVHYKILKSLNEDNKNIADSVVHEKEIEINNLRNDLRILKNNKRNLFSVVKHEWGKSLTELIINSKESPLKGIFNSEARLFKITITKNQIKNRPPQELIVFSLNQPEKKYKANFISKAPIEDKDIQGRSYFYLLSSNDLMVDSKINSYTEISEDGQVKKFHIPKSAIVWNNGKPWIYEQPNKNSFLRQPVFKMEEDKNGWIVQFENTPPRAIVTNGAQLILSEEYKHLITNENED